MTVDLAPIEARTCVVRDTGAQRGRHISITPANTAARHLHFGRIVLDIADAPVALSTGDLETGLLCLKGHAVIEVNGKREDLRFADVQKDASLHFHTGSPAAERDVNIVIGKNVDAGRILAGVTFSRPGNWTSWPPHEHAAMLEEAYLYIDMPEPGWGLQLVYNDPKNPEFVTVVRDGDVVLMPQGYHPNVSAQGSTINFVWMLAAVREGEDRQFGVVNVQPEYAQGGSGLEASRK